MIVLLGHLEMSPAGPSWWTHIGLYFNQGSAVYGFLLISGYSIAASLARSEPGFFWRRVIRIYPVYLVSLGLAAAATVVGVGAPEPVGRWVAALLMLQSFATPTIAMDGQLWTLAVEWWNYMLAPLFRRLPDVGLIILAAFSLGLFLLLKTPVLPAPTSSGLMFALLSWLWIVGFLYYRHRRTLRGYAFLFLPLALAANFGWIGRAVWIGAVALAVCEILVVPDRLKAAFRWLGDLSYPVYAVHVPILASSIYWGIKSPGLISLSVLAVSVVVLHAIDLPARAIGRGKPRLASAGTGNQAATEAVSP